ncbi:MAG: holo-ACP synthase [Deltaproteobacteria bacterium]|nr:holo-ACP synthase [Deltaproteobacteria bacterium]
MGYPDVSISGIGIDVVDVSRLRRSCMRRPAVMHTAFTASEHRSALRLTESARWRRVAGIWAAKEAFYKSAGPLQRRFGWKDLEIRSTGRRAPEFVFSRRLGSELRKLGMLRVHLSITHDGGIAAAFVVIEHGKLA